MLCSPIKLLTTLVNKMCTLPGSLPTKLIKPRWINNNNQGLKCQANGGNATAEDFTEDLQKVFTKEVPQPVSWI